jgi:hypothetical protein
MAATIAPNSEEESFFDEVKELKKLLKIYLTILGCLVGIPLPEEALPTYSLG